MSDQHQYWDSFYASRASKAVPLDPSGFARWVQNQLNVGEPIAEIGFGNARDALWFARQGHPVVAYDFAESAVDQALNRARDEQLDADFFQLDLYDTAQAQVIGTTLSGRPGALYGRFLIHAVEEHGRHNLLDLTATALASTGGDLYLEFRTGHDEETTHAFGEDHFRVYLDPSVVIDELEARGATIVHHESGHGLAVYQTEDPHVARIIARWAN